MTDAAHGDGMAAKFTFVEDGTLDDEGRQIPAWGFEYDGIFITNPYSSECSRFEVLPAYYNLTVAEAEHLVNLNKELRNSP